MLRALLLLPVVAVWVGYYRLARERSRRGDLDPDWRASVALACAAWGGTLVLIVEVLGALKQLNAPGMLTAWLVGCAALWWANRRLTNQPGHGESRDKNPGAPRSSQGDEAPWRRSDSTGGGDQSLLTSAATRQVGADCAKADEAGNWRACVQGWPWDVRALAVITLALVLFLGVVAALAPSTSWDALSYHLPRVVHWIQDGGVDHFPTNNERQIEFGPGGAFIQTTVFLLLDSDRLANYVQWLAMIGSGLLATLIARLLSPTPPSARTQVFAALLVATLPIGMVESITPLVDYVTAFWFVAFVAFALLLMRAPACRWYWLGAGLVLGLGTLTKVTMILYAGAPALALLVWTALRVRDRAAWLRGVAVLLLTAAVLNAPHLLRNTMLYGSPLGSVWIHQVERNKTFSVSGTLSNALRNLALHDQTGIPTLTGWLNQAIAAAHQLTGRDLNDPDTSYYKGRFSFTTQLRVFDSMGPCPWHLALLLLALVVAGSRVRRNGLWLVYPALGAVGFVLFCAVLRWQEWHTRIHLGWLVPLMPYCAAALGDRLKRWGTVTASLALLAFAALCLAKNESQPVFNREFAAQPRVQQMLWLHGPGQYPAWLGMATDLSRSDARNIGLKLDFDDPEYVLWALLEERRFRGRIDHFYVDDPSARIPLPVQIPDVLIAGLRVEPQGNFTNLFPTATVYGKYTVFWSAELTRRRQRRD